MTLQSHIVSTNAALHSLGRALALRDDIEIDNLMLDVQMETSESSQVMISEQALCSVSEIKPTVKEHRLSMPDDKPTRIVNLSQAILKDALSRPQENPHWRSKEKPTIYRKGRIAYKLDVYQQRTNKKIEELTSRMAAIGNKQDNEWKRLRK